MLRKTLHLAILTITFFAITCSSGNNSNDNVENVVLIGRDSVSVFDLLLESHTVDYDRTDMGIFIKAIDSTANSGGKYWRYFINGHPGQTAADKAITSRGDTIQWRYD